MIETYKQVTMTLHPVFQEIIKVTKEAKNPPVPKQSLRDLRQTPFTIQPLAGEIPPLPRIENHLIHNQDRQLIIRLYYPKDKERLPLFLYFHPGCFVRGSVDAHDTVCRQLALATGCIVCSLNYALAPEHPFPAGLEDGHAAILWMAAHTEEIHGDGRLAIGGEDSGGNLAAVLTHELRDRGEIEPDFQVLIYPQTDLTLSHHSVDQYANGYLLEKEALDWYISQYVPQEMSRSDPRVSPLFQKNFNKLAPALIISAECDPLRDEAKAYADRLDKSSTPVTFHCYPGMVHGFFQMGGLIDEGKEAVELVGKTLREAFFL
jgi:acetyl esterase